MYHSFSYEGMTVYTTPVARLYPKVQTRTTSWSVLGAFLSTLSTFTLIGIGV